MQKEIQLLEKVLSRNNFDLTPLNGGYLIARKKNKLSLVTIYLIFSISLVIIGFLTITSFGIILMAISVPLFLKVAKLSRRSHLSNNRSLRLSQEGLVVRSPIGSKKLLKGEIYRIELEVEKDKHVSAGRVIAVTKHDNTTLIEIFGDDKRYVHDDVRIIKTGITKLLAYHEQPVA